ncbi:MAG: glucose-6-phosphate isomerase [Erysipelotrichaceae bacterium]|nr:glucose-6-phosphate isomerase [Erysipelotrichaceae bacterium]
MINYPETFINKKGRFIGNVSHSIKYFKDLKNLYLNDDIDDSCKMYEVFLDESSEDELVFGTTIIYPILIQNEFNFTRGHFHENRNKGEYYIGYKGEGLLALMDENQKVSFTYVYPGSINYISGKYAHRLINIGDEEFITHAYFSKEAGHDYDSVTNMPFNIRVLKEDDSIVFADENNNVLEKIRRDVSEQL